MREERKGMLLRLFVLLSTAYLILFGLFLIITVFRYPIDISTVFVISLGMSWIIIGVVLLVKSMRAIKLMEND